MKLNVVIGAGLLTSLIFLFSACQPAPQTEPEPVRATLEEFAEETNVSEIVENVEPVPTSTESGWPPSLEIRWEFETGGPIWGTPEISDGLIYFGSDDQKLYAIDLETHELLWAFDTEGIVRSQPAAAGGRVYFSSDDGSVYAVDARSGAKIWSTDIGNFYAREEREHLGTSSSPLGYDYVQSSPVIDGEQLFVGSMDGKVYALAAESGKINWTYQTDKKVRGTPTVADGVVYIGSWDKMFYALDAMTGELRWKNRMYGEVQSKALVADGLVYCPSRKASLMAMDVETGKPVWEYNYGNNLWVESSPVMKDGIIYIGSSGSQLLLAVDAANGDVLSIYLSKTFNWSTPLIVGDTLYEGAANFDGKDAGLLAMKLVNGRITDSSSDHASLWLTETKEAEQNWWGIASSPVALDGVIYFTSLDGKLYAVSE